MGGLTSQNLERDFEAVGARLSKPGSLYVLGGSALILLGSTRSTLDLDFVGSDIKPGPADEVQVILSGVASELKVEVEAIPFDEFVPLSTAATLRHRRIGQFGKLTVFVFDPYSIALSKLERGFKTDFEDLIFLGRKQIISFPLLEEVVQEAQERATEFHMDMQQIRERLNSLRGKF